MKGLMIDYIDAYTGEIVRKRIDNYEFCVRDCVCYFTSRGENFEVELKDVFQVYVN